MKVLYPDNYASSISADEEASGYPATNMENDHVSEVWRGTSKDAQISFTAAANTEGIGIARTNAESATITVQSSAALVWSSDTNVGLNWATAEGDDVELQWPSTLYAYVEIELPASELGYLFAEWGSVDTSSTIYIDLTAPDGETIEAGALRAGLIKEFNDPQYGINTSHQDFSTRMPLDAGGYHVVDGLVGRLVDFRIFDTRSNIWSLLYDVFFVGKLGPYFFKVVSYSGADWEWIIFAWLDESMPIAAHDYKNHSYIDVFLVEAI